MYNPRARVGSQGFAMWVFEDAWMVNPHLPITHTRKRCSRSQAQALAPPPRRRHRRAHGPPQAALNDHRGPPPLRFRREVCGQGGPLVSLGNTCWYTTTGYVRRFQMAPRNCGATELDLAAGGAGKMPESAAFSALGLLIIIGLGWRRRQAAPACSPQVRWPGSSSCRVRGDTSRSRRPSSSSMGLAST